MSPKNNNEILVQSNSMLEILVQLSWFVEVPPEHVADGRTRETFRPADTPILTILYSKNRPAYAFVSIKMKHHWFYIDYRDLASKTNFGVIQILMSLAEGSSRGVGPLISIGTSELRYTVRKKNKRY